MPSWTRVLIPPTDVELDGASSSVGLWSDPSACEDFAYAESTRTFIEVEDIDADARLDIYRCMGALTDQLARLDSAPILSISAETVEAVEWPEPPDAAGSVYVELVRTAGSGVRRATVRVLQSFLSEGG